MFDDVSSAQFDKLTISLNESDQLIFQIDISILDYHYK